MRKTNKLVIIISSFAILLMGTIPIEPNKQEDVVDGDALAIGDVAIAGVKTEDGQCVFEDFTIETASLGNGTTKWMGLELQENCSFVVNAKWNGDLEEGPSSITEPLIKLLATQSAPVAEATAFENNTEEGSQNSALACKTSYQYVYMYGLLGPIDKLTNKWSTLTFCYNGSTATINSQSGTCQGSTQLAWNWVVDSCITTNLVQGPATNVSRGGRGDYHCSPVAQFPCNASNPDGYYHNLRETEIGRGNGSSSCSYGWGGVIVLGVGRQILQGCN